MRTNVKRKWTKALRSGKYKQGESVLTRIVQHEGGEGRLDCCLGVLCTLAVNEGVIPPPIVSLDGIFSYGNDRGRSRVALPPAVLEWAGLPESDDENYNASEVRLARPVPFRGADVRAGQEPDGIRYLTGANDDGYTFSEIADIIEEQL